jgi:hypothetical protein
MSHTTPIYTFQRGEPATIGRVVISGDPAGYAVSASLKPLKSGRSEVPEPGVAAVADFAVAFVAAAAPDPAYWALTLTAAQTAALAPGRYITDVLTALNGESVNLSDPAIIVIKNRVTTSVAAPPFVPSAFSIASAASANEGPGGPTNFTFPVTRIGGTVHASTVDWAVTGNGANPAVASDFVGGVFPSGTVTLGIGVSAGSAVVAVQGDATFEPDEGFIVTLSNPSAGDTISTATATSTILNDDVLAAPIYTAGTPAYVSDFSTVADNTPLRLVAGWADVSSTGGTPPFRDTLRVRSAGTPKTGLDDFGNNDGDPTSFGGWLDYIETGSSRHFIEVEIASTNFFRHVAFAATRPGDHSTARISNTTYGGNWVAGAFSGSGGYQNLPAINGDPNARMVNSRDPNINMRFKAQVSNGRVYLSLNQMPYADWPITNTGTKVGLTTNSDACVGIKKVSADAPKTHFIVSPGKGWYNRIKGWAGFANGGRRVTRSGTYQGEKPTGLYWRLIKPTTGVDPSGAGVIKDWVGVPFADTVITRLTGTDLEGTGTWSVTVDVEIGLDTIYPYNFGIGARHGGTFGTAAGGVCNCATSFVQEQGSFAITVGIVLLGQSENAGIDQQVAAPGFPSAAGLYRYYWSGVGGEQAYTPSTGWERFQTDPPNAEGQQVAFVAKLMRDALNLPVSVATVAIYARTSADLTPGGQDWANIQAQLGYLGAFEYLHLAQGSGDAYTGNASNWTTNWGNGIPAYWTYCNQPAGHVKRTFMTPTGFVSQPAEVVTGLQLQETRSVRAQQMAFPAYMAARPTPYTVHIACSYLDADVANGEFTNAQRSGGICLERMGLTLRNKIAGGAYDGRGPLVSTVAAESATTTLITYANNGAASMSAPVALVGNKIYADAGRVTPVSVSSAVFVAPNQVRVTHASIGTRHWCNYDEANPAQYGYVIGAYTEGARTIPAFPTFDPILAT